MMDLLVNEELDEERIPHNRELLRGLRHGWQNLADVLITP